MAPLDETVAATDADVAVATAIVSHLRGYGVKLPSQAHFAVQAVARYRMDSAPPAPATNQAGEVERLRAALEFYADRDSDGYRVDVTNYGLSTEEGEIVRDGGARARAALGDEA